jgi:hypothetical protein
MIREYRGTLQMGMDDTINLVAILLSLVEV